MQVHHAAQSHFTTNSQAWGDNFRNTTSCLFPTSPPPNLQEPLLPLTFKVTDVMWMQLLLLIPTALLNLQGWEFS
jgi:hypothetical protein